MLIGWVPAEDLNHMSEVVSFEDFRPVRPVTRGRTGETALVHFDKHELDLILGVYSRHVMAGEWRDYALEFTPDGAIFAIFRRSSEGAILRIVKKAKARQPGGYAVVSARQGVLSRGGDLGSVLAVLRRTKQPIRLL
tara:strand:+ start:79 stop:489 length:411 start_codon:yes stop_codon:yes gene_type:complete